jgi:hypothetical protein
MVFKELADVDSNSSRVSSYAFKRLYCLEEVPMFNARINQPIDHGCNWNEGNVMYSELENMLKLELSPAVAIY